jgi:hypothetical protein
MSSQPVQDEEGPSPSRKQGYLFFTAVVDWTTCSSPARSGMDRASGARVCFRVRGAADW